MNRSSIREGNEKEDMTIPKEGDQTQAHLIANGDHEAQNVRKGGWTASPFLLGSMFGLSLATTGAAANLVVYLIKEYNVKSVDAAQIGSIVNGCTSLAPVAAAIISDAFFGCCSVVAVSSVVSLLASVLFTLTAAVRSLRPPHCTLGSDTCEAPSAGQLTFFCAAVALLAAGTGGTLFNMLVMGATQFDEVADQNKFFSRYFMVHYASRIVGATVLVFVQDGISWTLGYGLSSAAAAMSVGVFFLGDKYYRKPGAQGSPFSGLARVIVASAKNWNVKPQENPNCYCGADGNDEQNTDAPTESLRLLSGAASISHGETRVDGTVPQPRRLCTVQQVEDLKAIVRVLPLWSSSIFVSVSIGMQLSLTVLQALTMDRSLGPHFSIPAGSISVSSLFVSMVSISLFDRFIIPLWRRITRHYPTSLQRIGLGHVLNAAGLAASALVERKRAAVVRSHHAESQAGWMVPMTALWLVLPMAVVGVGEALHYPGQVALYYQEFPDSLRRTSAGMMAVIMALGFYLSTAIVDVIRRSTGWLPDNVNASKMENVYWLMTFLTVVNFGYYVVCAMLYKYPKSPEEADDDGVDRLH